MYDGCGWFVSQYSAWRGIVCSQKKAWWKRWKRSTDTLVELAELVLKNNIFNFNQETLKQKRGTAIGTKFAPSYSILFVTELEEKILEKVDNKPYLCFSL